MPNWAFKLKVIYFCILIAFTIPLSKANGEPEGTYIANGLGIYYGYGFSIDTFPGLKIKKSIGIDTVIYEFRKDEKLILTIRMDNYSYLKDQIESMVDSEPIIGLPTKCLNFVDSRKITHKECLLSFNETPFYCLNFKNAKYNSKECFSIREKSEPFLLEYSFNSKKEQSALKIMRSLKRSKHPATDDTFRRDISSVTPLHLICYKQNSDPLAEAKLLVSQGASINANGPGGFTPLLTGINACSLSVIEYYIEMGADPLAIDSKGNNAFHLLFFSSPEDGEKSELDEKIKLLLENGLNPKQENEEGYLPQDIAKKYGWGIIKLE